MTNIKMKSQIVEMFQHSVHFVLPHLLLAFLPRLGQHELSSCTSSAAPGSTTFGKYGDLDGPARQ